MSEDGPAFVPSTPLPVSFGKRLLFGFLLTYLVLYSLPFPLGQLPAQEDKWPIEAATAAVMEWSDPAFEYSGDSTELPTAARWPSKWHAEYTEELHDYVGWFGEDILGLEEVQWRETGSGDTLFDWVRVALLLALALLAAPLLAMLIRRQRALRYVHGLLRVYIRYGLASTMLLYGFVKVFPLQFPALAGTRLYGTYGDATPMNMLWSFMGASEPYTILAGSAEVLGGLLLLFRRTTTLGALVSLGVMTHVMLLNFCYDVPVKLFSAHMVLFAAFLAAGDGQRLWALFISHRAMPPRQLRMAVPQWLLVCWLVLKLAVVAWIVGVPLQRGYSGWQAQQGAAEGPLAGIWEVREFSKTKDGESAPVDRHWRYLAIAHYPQPGGAPMSTASFADLSGRKTPAWAKIDPEASTLHLTRMGTGPSLPNVRYEERSQLAAGKDEPVRQLVLTGDYDGHDFHAVLEHRDESTFRINRTGFRWVQERPQNWNRK